MLVLKAVPSDYPQALSGLWGKSAHIHSFFAHSFSEIAHYPNFFAHSFFENCPLVMPDFAHYSEMGKSAHS